jgi:hypothetical protein
MGKTGDDQARLNTHGRRQVRMQLNELDRILCEGAVIGPTEALQPPGLAGLKAAIEINMNSANERWVNQTSAVARGRMRVQLLRAGHDLTGQDVLHPLDTRLGGHPGRVTQYGDATVNHVLGSGNVIRLRDQILALPDNIKPYFFGDFDYIPPR